VLREDGGCAAQDLAQHARREADQHAIDPRACPAPEVQRRRIVAELDPRFGKDAVGGGLDPDQVLFGQDVIGGMLRVI
jgi:hypothetical protein